MIEMSKIFLDAASGNVHASDLVRAVVTPQQPNTGMYIPNTSSIRRKTKDVLLARKETGHLPKQNKLKRLLNPTNADERAASK
jgi:hypothetical protein